MLGIPQLSFHSLLLESFQFPLSSTLKDGLHKSQLFHSSFSKMFIHWRHLVSPFSLDAVSSLSFSTLLCGSKLLLDVSALGFFLLMTRYLISNLATATEAGIKTIPLIMGLVVASIGTGIIASATGIYMPFLPLGGITIAVGAGLMSTMNENSAVWMQVIYLLLAGLGVGLCIQTVLLSAQSSVSEDLVSVVTAK